MLQEGEIPMNNGASRTVHLFVFDTMADWEAAYAVAAINNPRLGSANSPGTPRSDSRTGEEIRYHVATVATTLAPVTTMGGVRIEPDLSIDCVSPDDSAMLILPGGCRWEIGDNTEALELAAQFVACGVPVAAICAATLALARAGLLDHLRHTSNAREYLISTGYRGTAFYCGAPAVTDGNVITATGLAPVDFAREIFKVLNLYSPETIEAWYSMFSHGEPSNSGARSTAGNRYTREEKQNGIENLPACTTGKRSRHHAQGRCARA
jgi:putative intracellular protease/amidase